MLALYQLHTLWIFSPIHFFAWVMMFVIQNLFSFMGPYLLIACLNDCAISVLLRKDLFCTNSSSLFPTFSSIEIRVSCLMLRSLIQLLNLVQGDRYTWVYFNSSSAIMIRTNFWRYCFFSSVYFLFLCQKSDIYRCGKFVGIFYSIPLFSVFIFP